MLKRASLLDLKSITSKKKALEVLIKRRLERLRDCNCTALKVLKDGSYYRDYLYHRDYLDGFLNP